MKGCKGRSAHEVYAKVSPRHAAQHFPSPSPIVPWTAQHTAMTMKNSLREYLPCGRPAFTFLEAFFEARCPNDRDPRMGMEGPQDPTNDPSTGIGCCIRWELWTNWMQPISIQCGEGRVQGIFVYSKSETRLFTIWCRRCVPVAAARTLALCVWCSGGQTLRGTEVRP